MNRDRVAKELVKLAKGLTSKQIEISNRLYNRALNRGAELHIPWPESDLGEYGSGEASDRDMDRWVASNVEMPDYPVIVTGVGAGRTNRGEPVIIVHLASDPAGYKSEGDKLYPKSRTDALGRKLPRSVQAADDGAAYNMLMGSKGARVMQELENKAEAVGLTYHDVRGQAKRLEKISGDAEAVEFMRDVQKDVNDLKDFVDKLAKQLDKVLR